MVIFALAARGRHATDKNYVCRVPRAASVFAERGTRHTFAARLIRTGLTTYSLQYNGVEGLSGFSTDKCPVVAVFCCPRAVGSVHGGETVTVKSCQQAQSTSIT
jgi:hypothetical protein